MNGYRQFALPRGGLTLALHLADASGPVVVFQHGLCGAASQPAEMFAPETPARHAVLDCRGHGQSPLGPLADLSLATFSDDLAAAIELFGLGPCVVGGISMGAAIALRLAVTRPDLCKGLILARPAWLCDAAPGNLQANAAVGKLLSRPPIPLERDEFRASALGQRLETTAPDNLTSLLGFFDRLPREETAALLSRISADGPGVKPADLARLRLPTLVIGTEGDVIHPMTLAEDLAGMIPGARLAQIPPKGVDRAGHVSAFQGALSRFIQEIPHAQA